MKVEQRDGQATHPSVIGRRVEVVADLNWVRAVCDAVARHGSASPRLGMTFSTSLTARAMR